MLEIREQEKRDVSVSWTAAEGCYIKRTVITERVPIDEVPTCLWCGNPMFDARYGQKFCTGAHKQAYRRRRRGR